MINPIFLRTFVSLVKTIHFTHTAELLNMTQPGVSQHIKKLEAHLGKPLLNRHGKTFELTSVGETLYRYGLEQAEAEAELLNAIKEDDMYRGECRLACSGSMAMRLYPELLHLQKKFPGLTVNVEAAPNAAIVERIRSNQSDIGIITQPVNDSKLELEQLGKDALCLLVPTQTESTWQELLQLGFINHPDGHHYATKLLELNFSKEFAGMDLIPQSGYINQLSQILLPVSLGLGFTVLQQSSLDAFPSSDKIHSVALTAPINETVYLITKKYRILPSRYKLIREILAVQWS